MKNYWESSNEITLKELCKTLSNAFSKTNIVPFRLEKDKLTEKEICIVLLKYSEITEYKVDIWNNLWSFSKCKDGVELWIKLFELYWNTNNWENIYSQIKQYLIKETSKKIIHQYWWMSLNE